MSRETSTASAWACVAFSWRRQSRCVCVRGTLSFPAAEQQQKKTGTLSFTRPPCPTISPPKANCNEGARTDQRGSSIVCGVNHLQVCSSIRLQGSTADTRRREKGERRQSFGNLIPPSLIAPLLPMLLLLACLMAMTIDTVQSLAPNILVLGGTGFIGSTVSRIAIESGCTVSSETVCAQQATKLRACAPRSCHVRSCQSQ